MGVAKYSFGFGCYEAVHEGSQDLQNASLQLSVDVETIRKHVASGLSSTVVDFDDHLENCDLDWRNTQLDSA